MGVREVALSAMPPDASHLERMLVIENMIDLLRIRRPAGGNGNVDGMEIAEIDVDHAAGRRSGPAASARLVAGEDRVRRQVEATAIAADAGDLHGALIENDIVCLMSLSRAACRADGDVDR